MLSTLGIIIGLAWTLAAWFLILSAFAAPLVALVVKCKARGKRKFRDEPLARVYALHQDTTHAHEMDAL